VDRNDKLMRLRYAGTCRVCGTALPVKSEAIYERSNRTVRCLAHDRPADGSRAEPQTANTGTPGASARREFERRHAKREERIQTRHPKLGRLILALSGDQQSTKAWDIGAVGEERLGSRLNDLASDTLRLLHDRRIPGTRGNIDHLAVTPTGVYVIDAKRYKGSPHLKVEGGLLRRRVEKLLVGTRDCTKLVAGVLRQVDVVRDVLGGEVPVHGVLCFVEADWPLIGGSFTTQGVDALRPRKLYRNLQAGGPLQVETLAAMHLRLASHFPVA